MNAKRIIRRPEVEAITGLSRSTIYSEMKAGRFPLPLRLTARAVGWFEADLEDWMATRLIAANDEVREAV